MIARPSSAGVALFLEPAPAVFDPTQRSRPFPSPESRVPSPGLIAGVDEAGRGPLAGPVVVAAVVFAPGRTPINGLNDSKQLNAQRREALYGRIVERALAWHVVSIEVEVIDRINILQATLVGMRRAVEAVMQVARDDSPAWLARIDGNRLPHGLPCPAEAWIGGDGRDRSIMAASILAKVTRDRTMVALHRQWPQYGFDLHKGYPTPAHLAALATHGPCPHHRRSFAPVRAASGQDQARCRDASGANSGG